MALVVVGSVAFDTIRTPAGEAQEVVGGSATHFALAASWFTAVKVVAVVGADFGEEHLAIFRERRIDVEGVERAPGKTFRWHGEYHGDMNAARTLETQLNVFEHFQPKIPEAYRHAPFLFLGNIQPALQLQVRRQMNRTRLVTLDTMNFWIERAPAELRQAFAEVDAVTLNDGEARLLTGLANLRQAAQAIQALGPRIVAIKRGEHGVSLYTPDFIFKMPGYPLQEIRDPTGAGDSFAGGFMGYLAGTGDVSEANLRRAVVYGSVLASFTVEDFGLRRALRLTREEIDARFREFKHLSHFDL
ncbi:MAG: sugar kinase [Acidobacteria bacterium]|nr:MAG: sugar kinase [Acidobacteriota bacterium]